jgi:prefoldin subunit 5
MTGILKRMDTLESEISYFHRQLADKDAIIGVLKQQLEQQQQQQQQQQHQPQ